jgi:hypothetical protein
MWWLDVDILSLIENESNILEQIAYSFCYCSYVRCLSEFFDNSSYSAYLYRRNSFVKVDSCNLDSYSYMSVWWLCLDFDMLSWIGTEYIVLE